MSIKSNHLSYSIILKKFFCENLISVILICPINAWTTVLTIRPPAFLPVSTIQNAFLTVSRTRSLVITIARVSTVVRMVVKESGRKKL